MGWCQVAVTGFVGVPLHASEKVVEANPALKHGHEVQSINSEKGRRLSVRGESILREALDAHKQPKGVLSLPANFGREDVSVFAACWGIPPARLDNVVIGVKAERAVNLLRLEDVCKARLHVEQRE